MSHDLRTTPGYKLLDPRINAAEAPYTFFLPGKDELAAVAVGDCVQLMFEHVPSGRKWGVERMWVIIENGDGAHLRGRLASEPLEPTASVQTGDTVRFERSDVIAISWADTSKPSAPRTVREYWDYCLVDECVLDGSEPVEFIYREAPNTDRNGDKYSDSGWRIRGRIGKSTDNEVEARRARYVALGVVLNRDDSWLHLIDGPVGARYMRDFNRGVYVAEVSPA